MKTLQPHPAATIFPLIDAESLKMLFHDIVVNGLHQPIVLHPDGTILDGRNRYLACAMAKIEPAFVTWTGRPGEEVTFVVSANLHRRHLSESQRALVAAKLATLQHGGDRKSGQSANWHLDPTQTTAADLLNVGLRSVKRARSVLESGAPEVIAAIERGDVAVSTAADVIELPQKEQREIVARGTTAILKAAKRIRNERLEQRRAERMTTLADAARGNTPLITAVRYPIVYADPPWQYEHMETESRIIENHYPTMDLDAICSLPLADITTPDAMLFLWSTSSKVAEAVRVIDAWGFNYRTCMAWVKDKIGMGYYVRQQHELLLIAAKGTPPAPAPSDRPPSVVLADREAHSVKPVVFYELIEQMYPGLPRIELFARSERKGWAAWGNQAA